MGLTLTQRRVVPVVACAVLIVLLFAELLLLGDGKWRLHHTLAAALIIPGFVVWSTARMQLGAAFTTRAEARVLVTRGMYARFRHPIYAGGLVVMIGVLTLIDQPLLFVVVPVIAWHQRQRALCEERVLEEAFGDRYREYRLRTWP
ncbi:MAG TPA: isoprenylcysteine carboxylmethyltransferase family protein [Gemmatimonadaceae bacterium]|jgi:protein-S-isoprenylcysteine O-methyltransferase Ste14